jgi:hypothetical protein
VDAMPPTIGATAEGMVIVGAALIIIGEAIKRIGNLSNGQIIKGLVGIAGAMVILVLALNGFEEAAPGVGAMVVVAGALYILAQVMEQIGKMGLGQIIVSLVGIAGVLAVIGIAAGLLAPVIPEMLGLGAALALVGVGFALFGAAVLGVAMGLQILSVTGVAGMYAFIKGLQLLGEALPMIAAEGAVFIINFAKHLLDGVPTLIKVIGAVLTQLLETVIKLVPLIVKALGVILDGFIKLMYERAPELINAGVWLLTQLLEALNNNIAGYAELGILILSNLIEGIAQGLPSLLQAGADLIVAFLRGLASYETQVIGAAVGLVISMVNAIGQNANRLVDAAANLIISLVNGIFANLGRVADAGAWAIINFLAGLTRDILTVVNAGVNLVITLMQGVANAGLHLISAAATMLFNFLDAVDVVVKANSERITDKGISIGVDMLSGIAKGILDATGLGSVKDAITHVAHMLPGWLQGLLGISSPSKVFADLAKWIPHGVAQGIEDNIDAPKESVVAMANNIVNAFHETLQKIPASLDNLDVLQPTITPVLDLTNVKAGAKDIAGYMTAAGVSANISTDQASYISSVTGVSSQSPVSASSSNPTTLTFQQTINAPAALSTNDIYRQTKSQLVLAKEELGIQ